MEQEEPVTCVACGRKFAARFAACIYCKAPREGQATVAASSTLAAARPGSSPSHPPAGRSSSSSIPPTRSSAPPAPRGAARAVAPTPAAVARVTPVDVPGEEEAPEEASKMYVRLGGIAVVAAVAIAFVVHAWWSKQATVLYVVNTTDRPTIAVAIDGKVVIEGLPQVSAEGPDMAKSVSIRAGGHTVTARDETGAEFQRVDLQVREGARGFLFAPRKSNEACFVLETDGYGPTPTHNVEPLPPSTSLWEMTRGIDSWFQANPDSSSVAKTASGTTMTAVRMVRCEATETPPTTSAGTAPTEGTVTP